MRASVASLLAVFLAGFFPAGVMAQWTKAYGLSGTQVTDLAITGPHLVVGVPYEGVYFSADDGTRWNPAAGLPSETAVSCLTPLGNDLFAGTLSGRVFRSTDRGVTWEASESNLPGSFLESPIESLIAYGAYLFASSQGRVYRTGDLGRNWTDVTPKLPDDGRVSTLLVQGATLFAGTDRNWLHASTDHGIQWTKLAAPPDFENYGSYPVAAIGDWIYIVCGGTFFRSSNQGKTWSLITGGLPTSTASVSEIVQVGPNLLASVASSGVYRSEDGGVTWIPFSAGLPRLGGFDRLVVAGSRILLSTQTDGMFVSSDEGRTWYSSSIGLPTKNVIRNLIADGTEAFATTYGDLYRSRDGGSIWTGMDFPSLGAGGHSAKITSVILWGGDMVVAGGKGVWKHREGAASPWSQVGNGLPSREIRSVAAAGPTLLAEAGDTIYVLDLKDSIWKAIPGSPGPYISHDGGMVSLDGVHLIRGSNGFGMFRSVDGGAWSPVTEGLPSSGLGAMAVHGKRVFVGSSGLYRSEDKGLTWIPSDSGMSKTEVVALASNGRLLFAGTLDLGIFMSSDSGSSWTNLVPGYPVGEVANAMAVNDQHLYVSFGSGLWRHPLPGQGAGLKARRAIRHGKHQSLRADAAGRTIRPDQARPGPTYRLGP